MTNRKAERVKLTPELAREHFGYDPETGALWWKKPRATWVNVGDVAGAIHHQGYRYVGFGGAQVGAHRIAWMIVHGEEPPMVDHINGERADNRITNLRASNSQENAQNQRTARADNKRSRLIGAAFHKASGKFRARIGLPDGKQRHLGLFDTAEAAHAAYIAAKRVVHVACAI